MSVPSHGGVCCMYLCVHSSLLRTNILITSAKTLFSFLVKKLFLYFFIYLFLAVPRLSCGTWDLRYGMQDLFSCGMWDL